MVQRLKMMSPTGLTGQATTASLAWSAVLAGVAEPGRRGMRALPENEDGKAERRGPAAAGPPQPTEAADMTKAAGAPVCPVSPRHQGRFRQGNHYLHGSSVEESPHDGRATAALPAARQPGASPPGHTGRSAPEPVA
ncbi:hypothetical protein GCM10009544_02900 [Streptomyces stramineus]|uniref:Uncharacterized protein n=1 Tax=Streptomyces stramineus TaxID=173861 RepID=A0ABN0ZDU6_9ACTN